MQYEKKCDKIYVEFSFIYYRKKKTMNCETKNTTKLSRETKNLIKRIALGLFAGYLLTFLLFYVANYLSDSLALAYVWLFAQKLTYLLPLLVTAMVTLALYAVYGKKVAFLALIPFSLVRMIYFLPYLYLQFIFDGFDSVESVTYGALTALGEAALAYALSLLVFGVMLFIVKKANAGRAPLDEIVFTKTTLDFKNPLSVAFAIVSLVGFSYYFISEIVDTVVILVSYSASLTAGEIAFMLFSYVFDLALIFAYYFTLVFIKNLIVASEE